MNVYVWDYPGSSYYTGVIIAVADTLMQAELRVLADVDKYDKDYVRDALESSPAILTIPFAMIIDGGD